MLTKKTILSIFFLALFLVTLNGVIAYTLQIPLCNATTNTSCINSTSVAPVINNSNGIYFRDGFLYLTNDTNITHNITYVTYNVTNITVYSYNISNGSTLNIYQNVTGNDTIIRDWVNAKLNATLFNMSFYNKTDADINFAFKTELAALRTEITNALTAYSTKVDLDTRYGPLLTLNSSALNQTAIDDLNEDKFTLTWKIVLIIDCVLTVLLLIGLMRLTMSG